MTGIGSSVFTLCAPKGSYAASIRDKDIRRQIECMGTLVNIYIIGANGPYVEEAFRDAFQEITDVEKLMTTHESSSMLSEINRVAGSEMKRADSRLIEVARASLQAAEQSGGRFDPTVLPLLKAWGFRDEDSDPPESVQAAEACVGYRQVVIEGNAIGLEHKGGGLDFGGIAKGYAVDRAVAVMRDKWGISNAIVEAGGDLYVLGCPVDAAGWKIGIKNPVGRGLCATFEIANRAVATSGNYSTRTTRGDRTYTDAFDPRTGDPVDTYLSTSACAETCMKADAASTALFCAGRDGKLEWAGPGVSALHIVRDAGEAIEFIRCGDFPEYQQLA